MNVLVTGANGFIGRNLVERFTKKDCKIRILVRKRNSFFNGQVEQIVGDIRDFGLVKEVVKGVDVIYNLAALLPHDNANGKDYFDVNVGGLENLLKACLDQKIKIFIHVSTVGIFGSHPLINSNEDSMRVLDSDYARSKAEAERKASFYFKEYSLPVTVVRPTIGYGMHDTRPGFLNLFKLIKKGSFLPIGDGNNYFHTIYVENLVNALMLVMQKKEAIGEDFIIGDMKVVKMKEILREIYVLLKKTYPPIYIPKPVAACLGMGGDILKNFGLKFPLNSQRVTFMTTDRKYDVSKACKLLGIKSDIEIKEGLKRTYAWYKEAKLI